MIDISLMCLLAIMVLGVHSSMDTSSSNADINAGLYPIQQYAPLHWFPKPSEYMEESLQNLPESHTDSFSYTQPTLTLQDQIATNIESAYNSGVNNFVPILLDQYSNISSDDETLHNISQADLNNMPNTSICPSDSTTSYANTQEMQRTSIGPKYLEKNPILSRILSNPSYMQKDAANTTALNPTGPFAVPAPPHMSHIPCPVQPNSNGYMYTSTNSCTVPTCELNQDEIRKRFPNTSFSQQSESNYHFHNNMPCCEQPSFPSTSAQTISSIPTKRSYDAMAGASSSNEQRSYVRPKTSYNFTFKQPADSSKYTKKTIRKNYITSKGKEPSNMHNLDWSNCVFHCALTIRQCPSIIAPYNKRLSQLAMYNIAYYTDLEQLFEKINSKNIKVIVIHTDSNIDLHYNKTFIYMSSFLKNKDYSIIFNRLLFTNEGNIQNVAFLNNPLQYLTDNHIDLYYGPFLLFIDVYIPMRIYHTFDDRPFSTAPPTTSSTNSSNSTHLPAQIENRSTPHSSTCTNISNQSTQAIKKQYIVITQFEPPIYYKTVFFLFTSNSTSLIDKNTIEDTIYFMIKDLFHSNVTALGILLFLNDFFINIQRIFIHSGNNKSLSIFIFRSSSTNFYPQIRQIYIDVPVYMKCSYKFLEILRQDTIPNIWNSLEFLHLVDTSIDQYIKNRYSSEDEYAGELNIYKNPDQSYAPDSAYNSYKLIYEEKDIFIWPNLKTMFIDYKQNDTEKNLMDHIIYWLEAEKINVENIVVFCSDALWKRETQNVEIRGAKNRIPLYPLLFNNYICAPPELAIFANKFKILWQKNMIHQAVPYSIILINIDCPNKEHVYWFSIEVDEKPDPSLELSTQGKNSAKTPYSLFNVILQIGQSY
ncbi:hypothetical protein NEFER03_0951 [Nematocida sp. LUAm3]|nr:hypothetical protein NEFER03_0951 [Nematocida sp. LUAm3]KAI5174969.1 hypothetical protein NEFER02_1069 [Nematocida sp. LUAm2]KAI5177432.1 hypothetical protein NEFER01_0682 [Nematocida sp. LUAm1]